MAPSYSDDDSSSDDARACKKQRSTSRPTSFVTWNCNGLLTRSKANKQDIAKLVTQTSAPDVLFLQEVRIKATSSNKRNEPCPQDLKVVQSLFEHGGPFHHYEPYWSLADSRYSGTLTLLHKGLGGVDESMAAFSTSSAVDMLLSKYSLTRKDVGIEEMVAAKPSPTKQHASIQSFFSSNNKSSSSSSNKSQQHHVEGRFQFFSFPDMDIIHTYVPNHGTKPESFQRRQEWDDEMLQFLQHRQAILTRAQSTQKLLWAGDFNVAREYQDGTHWQQEDSTSGVIEEWWTNETKCFVRPGNPNRPPQYRGMPSFTPAERTRFHNIIQQGQLLDVWRELHPHGSTSHSSLSKWELPDYTWRGCQGKDPSKRAKYEGKGQRLDYFLSNGVSMNSVQECEILGYGSKREGFCGSDHCPVKLVLKTTS